MSKLLLKEVVDRYYNDLQDMVNDLAVKSVGGEEVSVNFPSGKVTIKLK